MQLAKKGTRRRRSAILWAHLACRPSDAQNIKRMQVNTLEGIAAMRPERLVGNTILPRKETERCGAQSSPLPLGWPWLRIKARLLPRLDVGDNFRFWCSHAFAQGPDMPRYKAIIGQAFALGLPARGRIPKLLARAEPNHQGWCASAVLRCLKAAPSHRPPLTSQFTYQRHSTCPESSSRERSISLTASFKSPFVRISHHKIQLSREFGKSIRQVLRSERL
jgi:hypothetical protein